jgi:hypothetical protein
MLVRNGKNWNDSYLVGAIFLGDTSTLVTVETECTGRIIYVHTAKAPEVAAELFLQLADDIKNGYIDNIKECGTNEVYFYDTEDGDVFVDDLFDDFDEAVAGGGLREFVSDYAHEHLDSGWTNEREFCKKFIELKGDLL